jgi:trehalose-6-phosphatase
VNHLAFKSLIIAVDFDGTIVSGGWPDITQAVPLPHALETLLRLQQAGHRLVLWTCREGGRLAEALGWCAAQGLSFCAANGPAPGDHHTASRKIYANLYIEDRLPGGPVDWKRIARWCAASGILPWPSGS